MYIHVYKLKDSELGFYHTGIEIFGREFTYCCDKGIVRHKPRRCEWGHFLGTICLGDVCLTLQQLEQLLEEMSREGFSSADYDVMENSCNVFSEVRDNFFYCEHHLLANQALATKLGLADNFPTAVHNQTKMGAMFAPVVRSEII